MNLLELRAVAARTPNHPSQEATRAWTRLVRVQGAVLSAVETELKEAGLPPLAWYDALLELSRAPNGALRPLDLEKAMLLPQYSTSRLAERLVKAGLVTRAPCPVDGRSLFLVITPEGGALQKKMWPAYAAAIERHLGEKLTNPEAAKLADLLGKLV